MLIEAFNEPDKPHGRILDWLAHGAIYGVPLSMAATGLNLLRVPGMDAASIAADLYLFVAFAIAFLHNDWTRICIRCMADSPLNPGLMAAKRKRWLWALHKIGTRWAIVLAVAYEAVVILGLAHAPSSIAVVALGVPTWGICYSIWVHHKLRPWCPYCPRWDGDGGIAEPSPDPTLSNTRTR